jgi:hypothetical protein
MHQVAGLHEINDSVPCYTLPNLEIEVNEIFE